MREGLDGEAEPLGLDVQDYSSPRVSPDGNRLVFLVAASGWNENMNVHDLVGRSTHVVNTGGFTVVPDLERGLGRVRPTLSRAGRSRASFHRE
jgi:hypothetical protein